MVEMGNGKCSEDLRREREKCSFNIEELVNIIDGGREQTIRRRTLEKLFLNDPEMVDHVPTAYLSHEDRYAEGLRKSVHLKKMMARYGINQREFLATRMNTGLIKDNDPMGLHSDMFVKTVEGQSNSEQLNKWMQQIDRGQMIGGYAQTELGHGSFVRGLETTATYDAASQQFVLHSPSTSALKWLVGGVGKTCNYAAVMAQLYTGGQQRGPHLFMVQLRDVHTHRSLPGITIGETGPRLGINANDNGFLKFHHHRIPRTNMFMKYSEVLEDGTYVRPLHDKLAYIPMMQTRTVIVEGNVALLMYAVTIATRYSAVRRQSEITPGEPEPQIMDFQTQCYKLLPQLSSVFAVLFSVRSVNKLLHDATINVNQQSKAVFQELHSLLCGLKVLSSVDSSKGVEVCRLACGGHGYLASANFSYIYAKAAVGVTAEGDSTVLLLQVARYLAKCHHAFTKGVTVPLSVSYFSRQQKLFTSPHLTNADLVEVYQACSLGLLQETLQRLQQLCHQGQPYHLAWNTCTVQLVKCAQAHARYQMCENFWEQVREVEASEGVRRVLHQLCRLYLLHHILLGYGDFIRYAGVSPSSVSSLEEELYQLLAVLRPQAVSLVDAFDIPDEVLGSTLGAWDGRVYDRLFAEAMKSPLNQTDVPEAFHKHLKPFMKASL